MGVGDLTDRQPSQHELKVRCGYQYGRNRLVLVSAASPVRVLETLLELERVRLELDLVRDRCRRVTYV